MIIKPKTSQIIRVSTGRVQVEYRTSTEAPKRSRSAPEATPEA